MSSGSYLSGGILYLNMGCHMLYILKNRLKAQNISDEKGKRIMRQILLAIFKQSFVRTVLIPQEPLSIAILKDILSRLAHSSIMKLEATSMEKLIYLIIMTVKKEFFLLSSPYEIYSLTKGNLQIILQYAENIGGAGAITSAMDIFSKSAKKHSFIQYQQVKEHILSILESTQTKVVNFTEYGLQNQRAKLVYTSKNGHNRSIIGTVNNHVSLQLNTVAKQQPKYLLKYENWLDWKNYQVVDHAEQYEKQSNKRHGVTSVIQKDKSMSQFFNIDTSGLRDYEFTIDLLEDPAHISKTLSKPIEHKSSAKKSSNKGTTVENKQKDRIYNQMGSEWNDLLVAPDEQEDELDLLQMMLEQ